MEQWKTAIYDGEVYDGYEVSNMGNVRNAKTGKTRKLQKRKDGYLMVGLWKDGKESKLLVHRIVAFTWIFNDDTINKTEVNHISEVKTDCRVENLEWCDRKYNIHHGTRTERQAKSMKKTLRKTTSKKVIGKSLTENKVIVFQSINQAQNFGFDASAISKCCRGKARQHHGYTWHYVD